MDKNNMPDAREFGLLRAYLAQQGFDQQWIESNTDNSKTRAENAEMLKVAMSGLLKGN